MTDPRPDLQAHYGREGLGEALLSLLATCAGDEAAVEASLARVDEFHPGGRDATVELARLAAPRPGARVLDLGCGIGGPARRLRRLVGPGGAVTGIDAVAEYCRVARLLNGRDRSTADIRIEQADILGLALPGSGFDLVWSMQVQMNVADKVAWVATVARHLRPGGRYAFFECLAGDAPPPLCPVPWADTVGESHLVGAAEWFAVLRGAGFVAEHWLDRTAMTVDWLDRAVAEQKQLTTVGEPGAALSVRLLLGPQAGTMSRNLRENLATGRVRAFMGVFRREA